MSDLKELRILSLDFRRVSSNFLNATSENASALSKRFLAFIDNNPAIHQVLQKNIDGVVFDYHDCFKDHDLDGCGWSEIDPPVDENCHLKAMYDYLVDIIQKGGNIFSVAMSYPHAADNYDDIIQDFISQAFKPLIDYITDSISKEMMLAEEDGKASISTVTQHINTVNGTVIQGTGQITATNTTITSEAVTLLELINKVTPAVDAMDVDSDVKESIKDDLEVLSEQIKSPNPKKSRMQKALNGVKKFANDFGMQLAVSATAGAITGADWSALISQINSFCSHL
ncbi:hypothetical protein [Oscillibacter ruminantium]|uniref:hypothetical protein n=1 Tax=Oscillibacter ruminantium TaxID=1263547 RepID=UPI003321DFBE